MNRVRGMLCLPLIYDKEHDDARIDAYAEYRVLLSLRDQAERDLLDAACTGDWEEARERGEEFRKLKREIELFVEEHDIEVLREVK